MATKPVCLICLQKFNERRSDEGVSGLNDNLTENFIQFLQQHLQIPPSNLALLQNLHHIKTSSSSSSLHLFCDYCKVVISTVCKLYQELVSIRNKLRDKLGKLEEIIDDSFGGAGGGKGENLLVSWISSQLKGCQKKVGNRQVLELRILLSHYCKLESSKHVNIQEKEPSPEPNTPKKQTDLHKSLPTRVTRRAAKTLQASPPSSPPISTEENITIKEEMPDQNDVDEDSNYFEQEAGDHHHHEDNSNDSSDGSDNNGDQDKDWLQADNHKDNEQDKPSSDEDDSGDLDENLSSDDSSSSDKWNSSPKKKSKSGRGRPKNTPRNSQFQPRQPSTSKSTSKKPDKKYHRRLVADKLNLYPDTIWSCNYCTSVLKSGNSLFTHLTYRHERSVSSRTFPCYLCSRSFGFDQTRTIHLKLVHWKEQPLTFTCTQSPSPSTSSHPPCDPAPSFDNPSSLHTHLQTHHPSQTLHLCTTCKWPFLSANSRILHELLHTPLPPGGQGYPCPMFGCTFNAGHIKHLVRHYSSKHDINEESFKCKICFKGFSNQATLNSHMRLHTIQEKQEAGNLPSDFKCLKCGKWHGNLKSLEMHVNRKHTLQKCPDCGVEKYYDAYRKHLWVKHGIGRGRTHVCDKCGKECQTKYVLKKHLEVSHHPEGKNRPGEWVCSECGKSYHGRVALQVHTVMKHMAREERDKLPVEVGKGRWTSKCLKCGKMFKAESDVLAHLYFMQKSCSRRRGEMGEGKGEEKEGVEGNGEGKMEEMREWFGEHGHGQEGEGSGEQQSFDAGVENNLS